MRKRIVSCSASASSGHVSTAKVDVIKSTEEEGSSQVTLRGAFATLRDEMTDSSLFITVIIIITIMVIIIMVIIIISTVHRVLTLTFPSYRVHVCFHHSTTHPVYNCPTNITHYS